MSSTPLSVLRPGLRLVNNMTMRAKLGVMTLLACLPLAYLIVGTIDGARSDIDVTAQERDGVAVVRQATALEVALLAVATTPEAPANAAIESATAALATTVAGLPHVDVADLWRPGAQALAELAHAGGPRDDAAALARLHALVLQSAERSALFFDPEPVSYFLMDQSVERLPPWTEDLGRLQRLAAAGAPDATRRAALLETAARLDREIELAQAHNEALGRAGFKLPSSWQAARAAAQRQAELARLAASVAEPAAPLQELAANGASAQQAVWRFDSDVLDALDGLLVQRIDQRYRSCAMQIAGVLLAVLAMVYVGACFHSSFVTRMRALDDALDGITRGDLAARIDIAGKDEIASMGRRMERMAMSLSALIAEIRTSAVRVEQAGQQVAADGRSMSHRADVHASGLRQSLQRVEALSRAVESTAGETDGLGSSTRRLMDNGEHGTQSMREAVVAITALEASMRRVAEINGMIDDIAFQTNLLALNAAVEAARAGEAGKGFAVVAAEVRQLAQRCAEAAGEVGALIEQTTTHAQQSSALIQDMSGTMHAMNTSVTTIADRIRSISRDAGEQSSGLGSVASTVGSLDELTRDNARAISESAQASQTLVTQAVALGRSVQSVRLRQGSADEARALVERARAVVRELGRDAAIEAFSARPAEWVDRDMYLFGLDRSGHFSVHCLNAGYVGQHISKVASVIAFDDFIDDLQRLASHDGAWIDYAVANPATGQQQRKNSFVVRIDDDLVLGCGVYRREAPLDAVNGHGSARELAVAEEAGL